MTNNSMIYGCMGLGGSENIIPEREINKAFVALDTALKAGFRRFDHADIYNNGRAETVFGLWLKKNPGVRNEIQIQSKTGIKLHVGPLKSSFYDFSKQYLLNQVDGILNRLQIEYLDMLLLHRPDPLAKGEELIEVFHELKSAGRVKAFGVSNMSPVQTEWVANVSKEKIYANQLQFSLGHSPLLDEQVMYNHSAVSSTAQPGMLQYAMDNEMEIQAWSPLDRGRFLNMTIDSQARDFDTYALLKKLARKYNVYPSTVALNWIMQLPVKIAPIIGSTNPQRIKALAKASDFSITREEWYALWVTARDEKLP